jgi:anti-sigma B factor antagonist
MQISKVKQQDMIIFNVKGDIDINSSPEVRKVFEELTNAKEKKLLLNLKDVEYVDSSGLATLVEVLKRSKVYGGKLKICNLSGKVRGLFEITKLDKLFDIYDTEEKAVAAYQ